MACLAKVNNLLLTLTTICAIISIVIKVVFRDNFYVHLGLGVPSVIFEYMNIYSKEHKVQWEKTTYSKLLCTFYFLFFFCPCITRAY